MPTRRSWYFYIKDDNWQSGPAPAKSRKFCQIRYISRQTVNFPSPKVSSVSRLTVQGWFSELGCTLYTVHHGSSFICLRRLLLRHCSGSVLMDERLLLRFPFSCSCSTLGTTDGIELPEFSLSCSSLTISDSMSLNGNSDSRLWSLMYRIRALSSAIWLPKISSCEQN